MEHADHLSDAEKRQLVRDGFVILRNAVPQDLRQRAKRVINENPQTIVHGENAAINGLYNDSILATVLDEAMGPHTRPINAQVAVTMPHTRMPWCEPGLTSTTFMPRLPMWMVAGLGFVQ
ncbi:MAG: hypothetical protein CM1200mP9_09190 [Gammaproteobacteria bacterium]|nr:MAG: hypothetical protein CM1200mP9_09190 [Gammaproteobacteria bacterium]